MGIISGLILGVVFLLLWGGHWMPWAVVPGATDEKGQLHRVLAYGYGCVCILVGFALWVITSHALVSGWSAFLFLGKDMIAAGLGTMMPRMVRWIQEHRALQADVELYEQVVETLREKARVA